MTDWKKTELIDEMSLERFATKHNLTAIIKERPVAKHADNRFYAYFDRSDVLGDGVLIGTYGDGPTPDWALSDYATRISLKTLVIDATRRGERREIQVPRVWHPVEEVAP